MICICFSHDVIISHHLSLRRITAIIMTHSQRRAKRSNRAWSLLVHTKPEVTWKGLLGHAKSLCDSLSTAVLRIWEIH